MSSERVIRVPRPLTYRVLFLTKLFLRVSPMTRCRSIPTPYLYRLSPASYLLCRVDRRVLVFYYTFVDSAIPRRMNLMTSTPARVRSRVEPAIH